MGRHELLGRLTGEELNQTHQRRVGVGVGLGLGIRSLSFGSPGWTAPAKRHHVVGCFHLRLVVRSSIHLGIPIGSSAASCAMRDGLKAKGSGPLPAGMGRRHACCSQLLSATRSADHDQACFTGDPTHASSTSWLRFTPKTIAHLYVGQLTRKKVGGTGYACDHCQRRPDS